IIIGFNDSIAWGVTNAQRDVKDYYKIRFKDDKTKEEYWFDSAWHKTQLRIETIKVKGGKDVLDTVAYTVFGPVMYDKSFRDTINKGELNLAVRWTAHDPSNEGIAFYKLNRAKNYDEYATAIKDFQCPGQNFVFASNTGDIAIWQQGRFPARWDRQGLYVMPGEDSSYMWQGFIPQGENPHSKNPERGFLESANQRPADATYPYFIPGSYITERAVTIEHYLNKMNNITPEDMMKLQNNYYNTLAEDLKPLLLHFVNEEALSFTEKKYLDIFKNWDLMASPDSKGQTVYQLWYSQIREDIWEDDMTQIKPELPWPNEETTMEWLKRDTAFQFIDNRNTPQKETLRDIVTSALQQITNNLSELEKEGKLSWAKYKNPTIYHLLKSALPAFARSGLHVGGNGNIINAVTHSHGPSWRMIVEMSSPTEAYGVYPGGQSGNPGSPYYDNFIDNWVVGKYYKL
ncbi:MAG TPA: penicillin acylase family protein, partial [Chitinophagaceae bacterium]|nr:penicillin acylase family protein [Chitinophagaceae bacterium]